MRCGEHCEHRLLAVLLTSSNTIHFKHDPTILEAANKEAVYKLFDLPGLSFKDEILILNRKLNGQLILLEGIVQRNIPKKNFMVKIAKENDLLIAVAVFKAEP